MTSARLESFSDNVLSIILTIMVLGLRPEKGDELSVLRPMIPALLSYGLSFIYIGFYWANHHHTLLATEEVDGSVLWANLHLLFWLSLIPVTTGWMGENDFATVPTALYGIVLLMTAIAYRIFQRRIIRAQGPDSLLKKAIGSDWKGKLTLFLYLVGIGSAFLSNWSAQVVYAFIAMLWLIPDKRIERVVD